MRILEVAEAVAQVRAIAGKCYGFIYTNLVYV